MELLSEINDLLHLDSDFPEHGSSLDYGEKQLGITINGTERFVIRVEKID